MASTATAAKIVAAAKRDVGRPGGIDTCVSNGMQRFSSEAGAPKLTNPGGGVTASVTEARADAKAKRNGWSYHAGLTGLQPGDFVDWAGIFHVSCVIAVHKTGSKITGVQSIGSGGPTGLINWQPAGAGFNAPSLFKGYFRAPYATKKPTPTKVVTVKAVSGDSLASIGAAHHVSLAKMESLNPGVKPPAYTIQPGETIRIA